METRDFIATHAMQMLLQRGFSDKLFQADKYSIQLLAKDSYAIADAMLAESLKGK